MTYGYAAIHRHNWGLLVLRGISSTGQYGHAKQCGINALDTNYLLSTDEVMANTMHMAQNMEEELPLSFDSAFVPYGAAPPIFAFVADGRGQLTGRPQGFCGGRGGRGHVSTSIP
jgi:hypothetical protein